MKILKNKFTFLLFLTAFVFISCSQNEDLPSDNLVNIPNNNRTTGVSANELLSETIFNKIYIEMVYVEGNKPTTAAINNFRSFLSERLNKSGGITIVQKSIPATSKNKYSISVNSNTSGLMTALCNRNCTR